jgi:hypothetical protein
LFFKRKNKSLNTNANINTSSTYYPQITWANDFEQSTSPYPQKKFIFHMILLELGYLATKQLTIALLHGFDLVLTNYLSTSDFNGLYSLPL